MCYLEQQVKVSSFDAAEQVFSNFDSNSHSPYHYNDLEGGVGGDGGEKHGTWCVYCVLNICPKNLNMFVYLYDAQPTFLERTRLSGNILRRPLRDAHDAVKISRP